MTARIDLLVKIQNGEAIYVDTEKGEIAISHEWNSGEEGEYMYMTKTQACLLIKALIHVVQGEIDAAAH